MLASDLKHEFADRILHQIADYATHGAIKSDLAYDTARASLADSIGCAMLALNYPACTKLLGPFVPDTLVKNGCRIPGTSFTLDPVAGAFNIGTMIRWLDYNDTWLAAEWGHPSDNFGAILALADYRSRNGAPLTMKDVLTYAIKAYEIQGVLALTNSFNRIGFDHVILVKIASAAICCSLLNLPLNQTLDAISGAFIDTGPLRTYRHAPNTGSRKSWAAGDAVSRAVFLALMTERGEMGYPKALTASKWGVQDVLFKGKEITLCRSLDSYVMENILFKISFPAEFHAQTAIEAAIQLHSQIDAPIETIEIATQESASRIIDKTGKLHNPADRDHCLQYMVAIALLKGNVSADDYEDEAAKNPDIDALREKMKVRENPSYTKDYLDPDKRSIANALTVKLKGGKTLFAEVDYPIGHRRRRDEGLPLLFEKCRRNLLTRFNEKRVGQLLALFNNKKRLENMPVHLFMDLFLP